MTGVGWRKLGAVVGLIGAALILGAVALSPGPACADSWALPSTKTYLSCNSAYRLTVEPRQLENQLRFFEDKVAGVEPSGQSAAGRASPQGILERRTGADEWSPVWSGPLVNDVSPVSALVSASGDYVVTFDNWHSMGFGDDVVVIYGGDGRLIRSLALTDILPEAYVGALPRSVSSLHWSGEHRIEGGRLILQVRVPEENDEPAGDSGPAYVEAVIDLATGRPRPLEGPRWQEAFAAGERVSKARAAAEAAHVAWMRAPLTGPGEGAPERDWFPYLREAFYRLDPDWEEGYPNIKVLREPDGRTYAQSRTWMVESLTERPSGGRLMLASASQANMLGVVREALAARPQGSLRGVTVYVVAGDAMWPEFQRLFAPSGARLVQLDPSRPIPQRPERLRDLE
jgi:hypothetical protein